jgi:hypothetical protein
MRSSPHLPPQPWPDGAAHDAREVPVAVPTTAVFELVADVDLLPTWNDVIDRLAELPGSIDEVAMSVVVMHPSV